MCRKLMYLISFILVLGIVLSSVSSAADPSLVGWWKFDVGSGNTAIDSSGNGFDITLHNTTWEDGVFGGAVNFNGVGYGDVGNFRYSDNAITVCAWVWHDAFRIGKIERYVTVGQEVSVIRKMANGRLQFYIKTDGNLRNLWVPDVLTEGQWHHVAGTWDGLNQRLYIDGMEIASQRPGGILGNTSNVTMSSGGEPFNGMLDEVRIYNRALTQDEIQVVMQGKEWPFAFIPEPSVGAIHEDTWVKLSWFPGDGVASHDVYFGENFDDVNDGTGGTFQGNQTTTYFVVGSARFPCLIPGTTYYWRIDEVDPTNTYKGDVWSFTVPLKTAYDPYPPDGAKFVDPNVPLCWTAGFGAKLQHVYFGDNFANVNDADTSNTTGIYRGVQTDTTYTPGPLQLAKTYYWRVDEFDGSTTHKGDVWSFTTTDLVIQEYYVATDGNDNNRGSINEPFRTIQKAANVLLEGNVCYIRGGIYRESVRPLKDGVMFTNYDGEYVLITGLDIVSNWQAYSGNIYEAVFSFSYSEMDFTQVFADGKRMTMARWPNLTNDDMLSMDDWVPVTIYRDNANVTFHYYPLPHNDWIGGIFHGVTGAMWCNPQGIITSSKGNQITCADERTGYWQNGKLYCCFNDGTGEGYGYITNHLNALDTEGEWHWENNRLYLWAPNSVNPNSLRVEARKRRWGFVLDGRHNIELNGLHFKAASISMADATGCVIDHCTVRYPVPYMNYIAGYNPISENLYGTADSRGIHVRGSNNIIRNCYIAYSWGDGVTLEEGDNNIVENCIIEETDWIANYSSSIVVGDNKPDSQKPGPKLSGTIIRNNTLRRTGRFCISHFDIINGRIEHNHMYDGMLLTKDGGITYCFHSDGNGTVIAYNWIHDSHDERIGPGIYLDNASHNYIVHHNVIWNCAGGIGVNLPAYNHEVYNNTLWANDYGMGSAPSGEGFYNCKIYNNLSRQNDFKGNDLRNNLYSTNAGQFIDAANGDFRLKAHSLAIDYGCVIPDITDGYAFLAPEAGAYEYGSSNAVSNWTAGSNITISEWVPTPPTPPDNTLAEALDTTALSFTTGGSADWFSQTTTSRYDGDAAQSPDISHSQDSWMQTTVSGTGTVKFYWKVSSEEDFDFLEFYIDGLLQEKISGLVNWEHKTYTISTSGSHTLEWRYVKDGSVGFGSDCGWVDKVEWVTN
ncbi:MAG: LamG-like jellyroll fold domain-containing protein [Phycisphaerae bacterium]